MATQVTLNSGSVDSAGSLALKTNGTTTAVTINSSQGVEFNAGTAALPSITTTGDTNTGIFFPAADTIAFSEGGAEAMRIDSSGNVGIGNNSIGANYKLSVNGTGNFYNGVAGLGRVFLGDPADSSGYIGMYRSTLGPSNSTTAGNGLNFAAIDGYTFSTGAVAFGSQTERMRIDSSGNLLVGKTTTATTTLGWSFGSGTGNAKFSTGNYMILNRDNDDILINFRRSDSSVGTITVNSTNTAYNTSSDYRLKNTITPMTGALAKVAALKPCTYKWNVDGSDGQGFIAHELQEVVEGCVTGAKDAVDADGNPQYQGIDTSFLVATLTAAIQEQQALITALTTRITALESK